MQTPPIAPRPPIDQQIVRDHISASGLADPGSATIRELNRLVSQIEAATGERFIRMEMGIPGLEPPAIAVQAEAEALRRGVGSKYPPFDGIPELKTQIAAFIKNFMDLTVSPQSCLPTVGAMQGTYLAMLTSGRRFKGREKILFLDPGFPVNKRQAQVIGLPFEAFDVYAFRGARLRAKLASYLARGEFAALLYSTPNNPTWICYTEEELRIIGELCTQYNVIALEDQAYFGMDFRTDYSRPGQPPFIPTAGRYTDNYILLISSSKSFSLAGQRIGMLAVADALFTSMGDNLLPYFGSNQFGYAMIFGGLYALSSGVTHSAQWGLTELLSAVNRGAYDFVSAVKEYGQRASAMKRLFLKNGFALVYDHDGDRPLADGFYFTVGYAGFSGVELVEELLYYGISAISLSTTGSTREGVRACVSLTGPAQYSLLDARLARFHQDHQAGVRLVGAQR